MSQTPGTAEESDRFRDFLLAEYSNIAQAHFKTTETISAFLKHYLTIISAPIAILGLVVSVGSVQGVSYGIVSGVAFVVAILFVIVSFVGLMVASYIINLRMDALLYARTVNGIRKYFYDQECQLGIATKNKLRVLPQSPLLPTYREFSFFGSVVMTFSLLNTVYFYSGCAVLAFLVGGIEYFGCAFSAFLALVRELFAGCTLFAFSGVASELLASVLVPFLTSIFFIAHIYLYLHLARLREGAYLRSNIFGVDIDGVINQHREQFCRLLHTNTGKQIDPEQITTIPVHDCPSLAITREDEKLVFNDPTYWTEMRAMEGAADTLKRLQNSMRLKIHIFTHRPWPITLGLSCAEKRQINRQWANASKAYVRQVGRNNPWWSGLLARFRSIGQVFPYRILRLQTLFGKDDYIDRITKAWLEEHGFQYDRIMIEKGSEEAADPSSHIINRFYACRTKSIRYFVEDDLIKAKKLAFICDVVFLMDHPYNQTDELPANVIRVPSWDEILHHMREIW